MADEKNGAWGQAIEVPGLGPLNASNIDPLAFVASVSCAYAGQLHGHRGLRVALTAGCSWPARRTASGARRPACPFQRH